MARYIGAVKTAEIISKKFGIDISKLVDVFAEIPTADVEPVKHGKWISVDSDVIFECSECGTEISTSWDYDNPDMFTYCPCCGAKMDKED